MALATHRDSPCHDLLWCDQHFHGQPNRQPFSCRYYGCDTLCSDCPVFAGQLLSRQAIIGLVELSSYVLLLWLCVAGDKPTPQLVLGHHQ